MTVLLNRRVEEQINTQLLKAIVPTGRAATIPRILRHKGYVASFNAPGRARVAVSWYVVPKSAHLSRVAAKLELVATGHADLLPMNARATLKVVLTARGRQLLSRVKGRLTLVGKGSYAVPGKRVTSVTKTFTLQR